MKKVILSIALMAGIFATANIQATNSTIEQPIVETVFDDDGFVDVKFEELNEKVQEAVRGIVQEYDLNALKYNAEKQITKVEATKKEDQSKKTFYFDAEGKEKTMEECEGVEKEPVKQEETLKQETEQELPSPDSFNFTAAQGDDGFVEVKLEELNEKVQAAVNALKETYDIDAIKYNAEKQVTKVKVTSKADQSKNKFYFDNEGVETTWEKPAKDVEKETKTEEVL